ncbi:MAG TPA: hypothetical protein VFB50_21775, partial [Chloroflexota bacterium]|nr:hypothetical protein [Chloroflexota bacterium]
MIPEFAEALAGRLGFDRSLSRAVRQEVEDHLWEAAAAELTDDPLEAQRRAIAKFGDPRAIAREIAAVALARSARRAGVAAMLVSAIVFVAMKTRLT